MGILVFGTPTLLLLGFDFASVLGWLLPSSLAISLLQVVGGARRGESAPSMRAALVGIPLLTTLSCILLFQLKASVDLWIGLTMLSVAMLRQSAWLKERIALVVSRYERVYLVLMGAVHGATNMGGALLALYALSAATEKRATRLLIARYYLLFGTVQLAVLFAFQSSAVTIYGLTLAPFAAATYLVVGNMLFNRAAAQSYERAFTVFIAAYGFAVLGKGYL